MSHTNSIAEIRSDYRHASLSEQDVAADPIEQFTRWFNDARDAKVAEVNAMGLSTVNGEGRPTSRIVLLKDVDERGLTWFTHYTSNKGKDLARHPHAALLFFWSELERQVRIEGRVEKISVEDSDSYFHSRPIGSQHGALASRQSQPIAHRALLEQRFDEIAELHGDQVPRPDHWGGYRLVPDYFEFWQGRPSRLHDRITFTHDTELGWVRNRLQP